MKKEKLRPQDIKYEPVEQERVPLWMHSVERPQGAHIPPALAIVLQILSLLIVAGVIGLFCWIMEKGNY